MSDISKKIQEIDNKGIEKDDAFLDKTLEDYKKMADMLKVFSTSEEKITFSDNLEKFNEECSLFINYIRQYTQNDEITALYILRQENIIQYGKYAYGIKADNHSIEMISNEDLKKLYELLQNEFSSSFVYGCIHTFGQGWSLKPMLGKNVTIDINSDNSSDRNWFYEETHKDRNNESSKKK